MFIRLPTVEGDVQQDRPGGKSTSRNDDYTAKTKFLFSRTVQLTEWADSVVHFQLLTKAPRDDMTGIFRPYFSRWIIRACQISLYLQQSFPLQNNKFFHSGLVRLTKLTINLLNG